MAKTHKCDKCGTEKPEEHLTFLNTDEYWDDSYNFEGNTYNKISKKDKEKYDKLCEQCFELLAYNDMKCPHCKKKIKEVGFYEKRTNYELVSESYGISGKYFYSGGDTDYIETVDSEGEGTYCDGCSTSLDIDWDIIS